MSKIIAILLLVIIAGCTTFNLEKFKFDKEAGTVEFEKVETEKKCQSCH